MPSELHLGAVTGPADATGAPPPGTRRDFLSLAFTGIAAVGAAVAVWPLIDSMNPAQDTLAAGAPIDVDLAKVAPGQQIIVMWRSKPIFVSHRTPGSLKTLQSASLLDRLRDPDSAQLQQPPYAANWHRSIEPEFSVLIGICTHLGCIPKYFPMASATEPVANWPGGYFCPCHGSRYDLAGRVFQGVPAPLNLPVPPYRILGGKTLRIGENPPGSNFDLGSIEQM